LLLILQYNNNNNKKKKKKKKKKLNEIITAQDQALQTKYHITKMLQTQTDSKCRLCQQFGETVEHIISACPILAKEQCIKRHDKSVCSTTL
jgi:hypothetical protein